MGSVIIITACLAGTCSENRLPILAESCNHVAMATAYLPQWSAAHPNYEIKRWTCVPFSKAETPA
jgi:hypothetical protein